MKILNELVIWLAKNDLLVKNMSHLDQGKHRPEISATYVLLCITYHIKN